MSADSSERRGQCMCGAVRYTASVDPQVSACHCGMCRRWAGGPFFGVNCERLSWDSEEHIGTIQSSAWAERGFCTQCGSALFYRITAEGKFQGTTSVAMGTLDDQTGLTLTREWFIDKRPPVYELAGERETVTEAEIMAMFGAD